MNLVYIVDEYTAVNIVCVSIIDGAIILYTVDKTIIIRFRRDLSVGICDTLSMSAENATAVYIIRDSYIYSVVVRRAFITKNIGILHD